jgi:hypothetical protein
MDNKIHDLDEGIVEYFDFKLFGHIYRFKQLNSDEIDMIRTFSEDGEKIQKYLYEFITKVDPNSPDFSEVAKKMTIPHLQKFQKMIKAEFSIDDSPKG